MLLRGFHTVKHTHQMSNTTCLRSYYMFKPNMQKTSLGAQKRRGNTPLYPRQGDGSLHLLLFLQFLLEYSFDFTFHNVMCNLSILLFLCLPIIYFLFPIIYFLFLPIYFLLCIHFPYLPICNSSIPLYLKFLLERSFYF